jgi:hypothetical protein
MMKTMFGCLLFPTSFFFVEEQADTNKARRKLKRIDFFIVLNFTFRIQCRLVSENRLPCPFGQAGTTLSLTVTLSEVEG